MDSKKHLPTFKETFIATMCNCPEIWDLREKVEKRLVGLIEFNDTKKGFACCFDEESYILDECSYTKTKSVGTIFTRSLYTIGGTFHGIPTMEKIKEYNDKCTEEKDKIKKVYFADRTILSV